MILSLIKTLLPNQSLPLPILSGPFQGAIIHLNPQHSLRKIFGIYEHELNDWLKKILPKIDIVLDVGANDGYFTFGCAAAFHRLRKTAEIVTFEPAKQLFEDLMLSLKKQSDPEIKITLHNCFVGAEIDSETTTLDAIARQKSPERIIKNALVKVDVEGAELEVIAGASLWLNPTNYFLIEVHDISFLSILKQEFSKHHISLKQVDQKPLPVLGRETRAEQNWWLVSELF